MNIYFALLRKRDFSLLCIADAISVLGDQAGSIALLWFTMVTTHKSASMGLIALGFGLPGVLFGAVSGNILDRFPRKRILVLSNVILGLLFLATPYLFYLHRLTFVLLMVFVIAAGCLTPLTTVGSMVVLKSLVSDSELGAANSLSETIWQSASLVGPLFAGLLISMLGAPEAVFVDGITFCCAAIAISLIRGLIQTSVSFCESNVEKQKPNFWKDVWGGLKYLYMVKPVWWITISAVFLNMAYGQIEVGLPFFVHQELVSSAAILGGLWTSYFIGSIVGSILTGLKQFQFHQGLLMCMMIIAWGICLLPLFWFHGVSVTFILIFLAGFSFAGYPPMARTAVLRLVPSEFQGRVLGIRMSLIALGTPVGSYVSGILAGFVEPASVIGIAGLAMVVMGVFLTAVRDFRKI